MLGCVKQIQIQRKLLTKHRSDRHRLKKLLMEISELANTEDTEFLVLRISSIKKRAEKVLRMLTDKEKRSERFMG